MKVQLNTDTHIQGDDAMATRVEEIVGHYLERFENDLTRVEVHLSDANGGKGGADDKHCAIEARLRNQNPIGVSHNDETVEKSLRGACTKLRTRLDSIIGQQRGHAGPRHEVPATPDVEADVEDQI